jgi:hypothetical protein
LCGAGGACRVAWWIAKYVQYACRTVTADSALSSGPQLTPRYAFLLIVRNSRTKWQVCTIQKIGQMGMNRETQQCVIKCLGVETQFTRRD